MENEVKEEVKVETKKKGNGLFTLFACVMTGIIVFLATNIGQKASKTVDPDTPKKNEVTSNVESNTTSNVVDTTVTDAEKTQVNEILGLLFNSKTIDKSNLFDSAYVNFNIFKNFSEGNASKLHVALYNIDNKSYEKYSAKNGTFATAEQKENILNSIINNNGTDAVSIDKVNSFYKKIFGTDITSYDVIEGCPNWYYDTTNKKYVAFLGCDFYSTSGVYAYLDSYTKNNDKVVVSAYIGSYYGGMGKPYYIYKDNDNVAANQYKQSTQTEIKTFRIDETNKTSFAEYNFTFAKNAEGNYYFESVAKAN